MQPNSCEGHMPPDRDLKITVSYQESEVEGLIVTISKSQRALGQAGLQNKMLSKTAKLPQTKQCLTKIVY